VHIAKLLVLLCFIGSASALETTLVVDAEHVWSREVSQAGNLSAQLELKDKVTANTAFTAIVRARVFGSNQRYSGHLDQSLVAPLSRRISVDSSFELELREFYFDVNFDNASLRLGKQQVVWGQADGLKLLDLVNPQDFGLFILDDFDESRIPIWMVNLELFLALGDLQILWIPDTSVHLLASEGATFEITAPFTDIPVPYSIKSPDRPGNIIKDSDAGTRLSLFLGGWDLTLNYLYHYDDFPVMYRKGNRLAFSPDYERTHTVGGTASNAFGSFILRSEIAFNSDKYVSTNATTNGGIKSSRELGYVMGIDWSGLTDTLMSVQLFQSILLDDGDYARDRTETSLTFLLRRYFLNESLNLELLGIYHRNDGDNLIRLSVDYELTSNTTVGAFADVFNGEPNELFGQFDQQDRFGLKIKVGF